MGAAKDAVPLLVRALQSNDPKICGAALFALGNIGREEAKAALPAVIQVLETHVQSPAFFNEEAIPRQRFHVVEKWIGPMTGFGDKKLIGRGGKGKGDPGGKIQPLERPRGNETIGSNLLSAVSEFDREMHRFILAELNKVAKVAAFSGGKINETEQQKFWQTILDVLKTKYPDPPAMDPMAPQPKGALETAPMPKQVADEKRPPVSR